MNPVYLTYDTAADVLYVKPYELSANADLPKHHSSRELEFHRHLHYDKDGRFIGAVFLIASRGIDLRGVPEAHRIAEALARLGGLLGNVIVDEEQQAAS